MSRHLRQLRQLRHLAPEASSPPVTVVSVTATTPNVTRWVFSAAFAVAPSDVADLAALTVAAASPSILSAVTATGFDLEYLSAEAGNAWAVDAAAALNLTFGSGRRLARGQAGTVA